MRKLQLLLQVKEIIMGLHLIAQERYYIFYFSYHFGINSSQRERATYYFLFCLISHVTFSHPSTMFKLPKEAMYQHKLCALPDQYVGLILYRII
jgi:hypothetical protein